VNADETLRRLGRRIREIRIERGFTSQEDLAEYLKVHRTFVGHLETGRKDFRITTLIRTAQALGVSLSEMFKGTDTDSAPKAKRGVKRGAQERLALLRELAALERSVERLKQLL
jgi:transcriptional regulator with XRE-family HTH domain